MTKAKTLSFAFAASVLGGCATSPAMVRTPLAERIPAGLRTCMPRPEPGDVSRQSGVASFVVELDRAGEDCRGKVAAIAEIVEADTAGNE